MGTTVKKKNGPTIVQLQEVVIGSRLRFSLLIEEETSEGVFSPMDFTGYDIVCHVKDNPRGDILPDAQFTCTPRGVGVGDIGWIDFEMDGSSTGTASLLQKDYEASVKLYPTGQPEDGDTVAVVLMPVKWRATR